MKATDKSITLSHEEAKHILRLNDALDEICSLLKHIREDVRRMHMDQLENAREKEARIAYLIASSLDSAQQAEVKAKVKANAEPKAKPKGKKATAKKKGKGIARSIK